MASVGKVTSLGVGSGFDLQKMLEDFRKIDEAPITGMKNEIATIKKRLAKFDEVNAKLLSIKSNALTLSLQSNFITRSAAVSDEEIASAQVFPGAELHATSIDVKRLASRSSFQTAGVADAETSVYIPTVQESTSGWANAATTPVITANDRLTVTYGTGTGFRAIAVDFTAGMTLNQVVNAINTDSQNNNGAGGTYVTASTFTGTDGKYHLRIASTQPGTSETNRVMIAEQPESFSLRAPDVTFSIGLGDDDPVAVAVAADTTFNELAEQINADDNNPGVTAAIINDGSATAPYRLVLTADNSGEDNRITVGGIQMTEVQGAGGASLNAEVSVNGILYQRQTNSNLTDIIQGVSLTLKKTGTADVVVTADTSTIKTEITDMVKSLNELVQSIKADSAYDTDTKEWGILADAYSVKSLPNELKSLVGAIQPNNVGIKSLFDIGLELNRDGSLTLNEATLNQALNTDPEAVSAFFLGNEETQTKGFADLMNDGLRELTGLNGLMGTEKTYGEQQIARMEQDIGEATDRLDRRYDELSRRFVELDKYIGRMKSESEYLTTVFDSIQSAQQKK